MFQVGDLVRYGDHVNDIPGLVMGLVYDTDPEYPDFLEVQWLDWEQGTLAIFPVVYSYHLPSLTLETNSNTSGSSSASVPCSQSSH